jgi:8-amino-7-oxononanoate synthase
MSAYRSLRAALTADLDAIRAAGNHRWLRRFDSLQQPEVVVDGRPVVMLSSSDVLGLSRHPRVVAAGMEATARHGCASGSSRLIAGNHPLHDDLEAEIARFKETEAALVFATGYLANIGVIPALVGEGDAIFSDALNHASIVDGCRLSRARVEVFRHGDPDTLEDALRRRADARRKLVLVDGVYSMDGDLAPLPDLVATCERHGAWLMVDDSHGTGVLGENGRGTVEHFGLTGRVAIEVGTLGKSLGSFGAWVAGPAELRAALVNRARSFIFTCALPPSALASARAALRVLADEPERRARLFENASQLRDGLIASGFRVGPSRTHILPLFIEEESRVMPFTEALLDEGVFAQGIRPPTVPRGTSRLRLCAMATHTKEQIARALEAFERAGRRLGIVP